VLVAVIGVRVGSFQSKPLVKHVLSKEQQLYYEYVISAMRGEDASLKKAVYDSISKDDGLHQLLPYFTQFIAEELANNLHNLQLLSALMKLANCLLHSKYLHIEPYVRR
jgi:transcription initiation factor TFIID subunit 6